MKYLLILISLTVASCTLKDSEVKTSTTHKTTSLRAPAYPLITIDPYTSAWSFNDSLYNGPVRHWTGKVHSLIGAVRIDNKVYRFLGKEQTPLRSVLPMAGDAAWEGAFTMKAPGNGWEKVDFNAKTWKVGKAAFGSPDMKAVNTEWPSKEIWVRREFTLPDADINQDLMLEYSHDDDFELYVNGQQVVNTGHHARHEVITRLDRSLLHANKKNVIAAHCTNTGGKAYVDFGIYAKGDQREVFADVAVQDSIAISATQTIYSFTCGPASLKVKFISPLLPDSLDLMSRPVNYVSYEISSRDGADHDAAIYFEITPEWAVDQPDQEVMAVKGQSGRIGYVKTGTTEQKVLGKVGDNVRIDWGYAYLAGLTGEKTSLQIAGVESARQDFNMGGAAANGKYSFKGSMKDSMVAISYVDRLGKISGTASGYVMIGYDDISSVQYFGDNRPAWWKKNGAVSMDSVLTAAADGYEAIVARCVEFDNALWDETLKAGGRDYADLCVLAFRQSIAAHKLTADADGNILFLSKENFSNGSIGTVDVTYPSAPLFLRYNPELLKGMMNPIFYYSESGKWAKPFAAHDVGTYPKANGQTYPEDMPVEECGNMLILTAAIAGVEGNATYAEKHWAALSIWADYLLKNGLNPENQLCTDDFAGHLAHNTNLSVKAIMGIASYGKLAEMLGKAEVASKFRDAAGQMAIQWESMANDGDHYRLTFDQSGTWSQKYNMVWDRLLGFNLFPKSVIDKEQAYYKQKQNQYGLPLDNRRSYTKSDWIVWTATLADDQETFQALIGPLHKYATNTPTRVPMSDWYETVDAKQSGFQARSVVGGYFIKVLKKPVLKD